ncbi:MAG: class I SAM-dependent methyltransferase, partial [Phycisphaeraceae bacterium]|nr:class I SAM-dependent methyltransferase [Phycisphaeraceae bacterium]
ALETAVAQQGPLQGLRRIDLRCADAIEALAKDEPRPDAIYIDPMFERHGSAQVRKTSQALRRLVGSTPDAEQLLEVALSHATQRVVVKRPAHAETLGSRAPASSLKQSSTRFDLYPVKSSYR